MSRREKMFLKMGHSRPLFLYFRLFNTVNSKQMFDKSLPMTGIELQISGVGGDRSTTEPQPLHRREKMLRHQYFSQ